MININYLDNEVLTAILNNKELPEEEESYKIVAQMSPREAFDCYLNWHGIIGYTDQLMSALASIQIATKSQSEALGR